MLTGQNQTLIMVTEDNLYTLVAEAAKRVAMQIKLSEWVNPEEAEKLLNLKRQSILKLWSAGEIDLTCPGQDNSKVWMASRKSIDKYLEKKRNYNRK